MYIFPTSLAEGRLPETFGWRSRGRPLRAWLVTTHSGGSGQHKQVYAVCAMQTAMPGGITTAPRGARWTGRRQCRFPEARPGAEAEETSPEMPRWSAERRAGQRHWPVIPGDPGIGPTARRATGAAFRTSAFRRSAPLD